jgi:glycosyltransferase involved in cell wall biosynthesis
MATHRRRANLLSLVVPLHNEEMAVAEFLARAVPALDSLGIDYEIIFVDDGSLDGSRALLRSLHEKHPRIRMVGLSRNFGKEAAMSAGFDYARGDVVVPIDADLQDPPELIRDFLARWEEGFDVVYGVRTDRSSDTAFKRISSSLFYRTFNLLAENPIPVNGGDYRLMDRRVVDVLRRLPERNRFMKGLFAWVGFKSAGVHYAREPRRSGKSKFGFLRLWRFALDGVTGFSTLPLRAWTFIGLTIALFAFLFGANIIIRTLVYGVEVPGYASMMVVILFLGSVQLITLGVIGEYISRLFVEGKQRPHYVVDDEW